MIWLYFLPVSAEANRGNVAIIVWNTLEAPYVWDVEQTEFEGTINLANSRTSLLERNFRDFATKSGELKELKEIDIEDGDVDDRQLKLTLTEDEVENFKFASEPRKGKDEKSYKTSKTTVLVYVPEEVVADLDELEDECVTLILGEDNVAVAVVIEEDNTEKDFLTAYNAEKRRITVGEEKYDLAKDYTDDKQVKHNGYSVKLNGTTLTVDAADEPIVEALELALATTLDATEDVKDIEKKIQAEITLNDDDEVEAIELVVSRNIADYSLEALVTEVKETRTTYKIVTDKGTIYWDLEAEEEEEFDFPKVYVDGERADIRDIEAGNVVTVMGTSAAFELTDATEDLEIYVSTATVEALGEDIDVKKKDYAVKVDGTYYLPTAEYAGTSDEELEDVTSLTTGSDFLKITECENVVLHLNMFGEYYAVLTTEAESTYTFGVVTWVDSNVTVAGDENEIQETRIRVLLADGTKAYYTLSVDTSDEDLEDIDVIDDCLKNKVVKGDFVMFEANADKVITVEDENPITVITATTINRDPISADNQLDGDYVVKALSAATDVSKDDEEFVLAGTDYEYDNAETVIFSNFVDGNDYNLEVVDKWSAIVNKANNKFLGDAPFMILADVDDEVPAYIVVAVPEEGYSASDATYATVHKSVYKNGDNRFVQFVEGEPIEVKNATVIDTLTDVDDSFVEYAMGSSKVSKAAELLALNDFEDLGLEDLVPGNVIKSGYETVAVTTSGVTNYVAADHANAAFWGIDATAAEDYIMYVFEDYLPTSGEFTLETYSEAFAELYTTGKLAEGIMTTKETDLDPSDDTRYDLGVLVKADGKVHEITLTMTKGTTVTEETIYVVASIGAEEKTTEVTAVAKENFEVKSVEEKSKYIKLSYNDDEDEIVDALGYVKVDKNALVYDLTGDGLVEASLEDITKGDLVIAYRNADCDEDAEANVLVIVK